jgi:hypothetical protein
LAPEQGLQAELTVRASTVTLSPQGPPLYLEVSATVHNWGQTTAPASSVNVYLSNDMLSSPNDYLWVAGLRVPLLPPGREALVAAPTGPPSLPQGQYYMFARCDALNEVAESHEENNAFLAGPVINGPDLAIQHFTYSEWQPKSVPSLGVQYSEPGSSVTIALRIVNRGILPTVGAYWLELWGSRTGGLTLNEFLSDSRFMPGLGALGHQDLLDVKRLLSIPDGPYTVTVVLDRTNRIAEVFEANNRMAVARKRLVELRAIRPTNLRVQMFRFAPNPIQRGDVLKWNGSIINDSPEFSGSFWIEFWGSRNRGMPTLDFPLCESIFIENLRPGQQVFLQPYLRSVYENGPTGDIAVICVVDRPDHIPESNEADNFSIVYDVNLLPKP